MTQMAFELTAQARNDKFVEIFKAPQIDSRTKHFDLGDGTVALMEASDDTVVFTRITTDENDKNLCIYSWSGEVANNAYKQLDRFLKELSLSMEISETEYLKKYRALHPNAEQRLLDALLKDY